MTCNKNKFILNDLLLLSTVIGHFWFPFFDSRWRREVWSSASSTMIYLAKSMTIVSPRFWSSWKNAKMSMSLSVGLSFFWFLKGWWSFTCCLIQFVHFDMIEYIRWCLQSVNRLKSLLSRVLGAFLFLDFIGMKSSEPVARLYRCIKKLSGQAAKMQEHCDYVYIICSRCESFWHCDLTN